MYNDFELINEQKMLELKSAYEIKLSKVKMFNFENIDFSQTFKILIKELTNSKHYISNLIKSSKNIENLNLLKKIKEEINTYIENLNNLYEISNVYDDLNDVKDNLNYNENIKRIIESLLTFLEELFKLINFESNIKIKNAICNIFNNSLQNIKQINSLTQNVNNLKIFSLFKNKYN